MMKEIDSKGKKYIGEFLNDLPENIMLNKVTTGSGMTSVVLGNNVKYVIAMPYVALIKNKEKWCKERGINVCAVYSGGADVCDIEKFNGDKIIVTYDSLGKVTQVLRNKGILDDWKLCVDECHKLVDSAAFRTNAINNVLNNYNSYRSYVFGTATPVQHKYQLPALKHIPVVTIKWENLLPVKVNYCHYNEGINDVAAILGLDFINGCRDGNAHIFLNSVNSICEVVRKMQKGGFTQFDQLRIVCADNPRNISTIESKLSNKFYISTVDSAVRKVNFYTATAFEGCDIYDQEGKTFIVTDGRKNYTKIDIVTVLPQIIGRIRDSKYRNIVNLLYSKSNYLCKITEQEFEHQVLQNIEKAKLDINEFESLRKDSTIRENFIQNNDSAYLLVEDGRLCLNENAWYNEMHKFSTLNKTYYVSKSGKNATLCDGIKNFNGLDYNYQGIQPIEVKGLNKIKLGKKASYKELCLDIIEIFESPKGILRSAKLIQIKSKYPEICKAYLRLGKEKMRALRYRKKEIEKDLLSISNEHMISYKVVQLLKLKVGEWYSIRDLKSRIKAVYATLGIEKNAKGTDISKWYHFIPKFSKVGNKSKRGILITGYKVKYSN